MTTTILFAAPEDAWDAYRAPLTEALDATGIDYRLARDIPAEEVDYVVYAPSSGLTDFTPFPRLKAVLSLWAGVEKIVGNPKLTVPLARMVDDEGLTQGMVEYVSGHVLRHHLGMDAHIVNPAHAWVNKAPPLARERPVTVLGLGMLGRACARQLAQIGFPVTGWSRTPREIEGLRCLSGSEGLSEALAGAQIVVTLLPFTPQTENTLGATELAQLAEGACIVNPGRGQLIDDEALLAALDSGHLGHATLDVFRIEPLPQDHPFWDHPKVTITPHIAAETRADSAARVIAENVRRGVTGEPLLHLVDRDAGY
ncbi:glyoxylate/hydroxypyruvate reductase A [Salipiger sp. PrR002]|uniref:2-hydroxyacid dehydrogenase n=1 Tax=Salipiger sp. PrR002 TaxID=2706489 RepID=UPI0013B6BB07|nr:glyoxylate/hydroxypyruvate reductase A [Salipiger sp. PrR002]NDW00613.1 glyoxylate/hydroxypyruvate reductase A [Salipiger sp. PrR002]NDW57792.1 glyoxylate/hydroxypyruvate reductase A [Salipiger sp. PrR004]